MPGNILFRPVEANLTHDTDWLGKMDPYCMFSQGTQRVKSSVCRHGGTRPHWGDTVSLPSTGLSTLAGTANIVRLEVFDKDRFRPDDHIAYTDIDLNEIQMRGGSLAKWYPLYHHRKPAGEILIEAAFEQQPVMVQQTVVPVTTTYVQETYTTNAPIQGETIVGESYVVSGPTYTEGLPLQGGLPLNQGTTGLIGGTTGLIGNTANLGSYTTTSTTVDPLYAGNTGYVGTNTLPLNSTTGFATGQPGLASEVSRLGPSGGFPHGHKSLKGLTNAGYSERPGYTLGDTEANATCQSNLDSNGGGFFNKPGRERRAEPYSLSTPGTYGIPHGQTIDSAGHLVPNVTMQRQAPIGTVNHPGITGYPDGFNAPVGQNLSGLAQPGSYSTGLPGSYNTGLQGTYGQPGSYSTELPGTYSQQGLGQPGNYGSLIGTLGQQQGLNQQTLGQPGLGQQGLGLGQPGIGKQGF